MEILLLLTKEYQDLLPIFAYLFNSNFGNDTVLVFMDKKPDVQLESNFEYNQVPAYKEGVWDWHKWFSNGLSSIFEYLNSELCLIFFPDQWIYKPVNRKELKVLTEYVLRHKDIVRANITANTCLEIYGKQIDKIRDLDIIKCDPTDSHCSLQGGISFSPSVFRGNLLPLESGWSLWECEKIGTERMKSLDLLYTIGTKQPILYREHVASHHMSKTITISKSFFDLDVILPMIKNWEIQCI